MRHRDGTRRRIARFVCPAGACLLLCACMTQRVDFGIIEEPVMLNADPVRGGSDPARRKVLHKYYGQANREVMASSEVQYNPQPGDVYTDRSEQSERYTIQSSAFWNIVGYKNRAVTGLSVRMEGYGINLLVALMSWIKIDAEGNVVELLPPESAAAAPAAEGGDNAK